MFKDIFYSLYNFPYYKTLARRTGAHTFWFAVIVWVLMSAAGALIVGRVLSAELPGALKALPAFSLENGVLTVNETRPYTLKLKNAQIIYEAAPPFPPAKKYLDDNNVLLYLTADKMYARGASGALNARAYPQDIKYSRQQGFEGDIPAALAAAKMLGAFSIALAMPVLLLYLISGILFAALLMHIVMRRQITLGKILKLCVYVSLPAGALSALLIAFNVSAYVLQLAQFCLSGMFFQQIFNNYVKYNKGE